MGRLWALLIAVAAGAAVWFLLPYGTHDCLAVHGGSAQGCIVDKHQAHAVMAMLAAWILALNVLWPRG